MQDPLRFLGERFTPKNKREQTLRNIRLIIRIRWIVSPSIFIIMFLGTLAGIAQQPGLSRNQLVVNGINVAAILALNVCYAVLVRTSRDLRPLILFQLFIDPVNLVLGGLALLRRKRG